MTFRLNPILAVAAAVGATLAMVSCRPAGAAATDVTRATLSNGLRVVIVRDPIAPVVTVEDKARLLEQVRPLAARADAADWSPASLVLLANTLADPNLEGVWGGTSMRERKRLRRTARRESA